LQDSFGVGAGGGTFVGGGDEGDNRYKRLPTTFCIIKSNKIEML